MTDYYISAAGSDSNSGSYSSPWQTLGRANTAFSASGLGRKDRVLFRRGDTFYGHLSPPSGLDPTKPGWLRISSYGDDSDLPVISGYKILNTAAGWTEHSTGVWKVDYAAGNVGTTFTGNGVGSNYGTADVGFIKVDGVIKGVKRASLGALANQWDFYSSGTMLYVKSSAKPTTLAADVRAAVDDDAARLHACTEVSDITFEGFGNGIYTPPTGGTPGRTRVLRCTIREMGGGYIDGLTEVRYGNGITIWHNAKDVLVEGNTIHDIYDAAYSIQGSGAVSFENVLIRRNLTYRCSQGEEYTYFSGTGPGFINCRSEYNTHLFPGYGFGGDTRPDTSARDGLQSYQWGDIGSGYTGDVSIRRNVYYDCRSSYSLHARVPLGLKSDYNVILLRPGTLLQQGVAYTVSTLAGWLSYSGREAHSQFITLPASGDVDISNADVTAALATLNSRVRVGQVLPIHGPWV